ncbi:Hpt domain-containing protein [Candidatus Halocynthiibacter alkanivorans]|jgi:histidine phosphotransfer protein HptB|uniref:Hpt domain-containing protein n=1 Tax=Candidatus Halocynthiibacter alkanivorans TaxID=2267619 RepID=UPI000DF42C30|nr:Hpt domain-containing protein [Candidatus Halocynthiibacter alkanivorans]
MIDWQRVTDLRDEVGSEDFKEVLDLFLEEVEEVITRMRRMPDPARYEEDLHFLKGSSLNLGFAAFSTLCEEGEQNALQGKTDLIDLAKVFATYEASKAAFAVRSEELCSAA